MQLKDLKDLKDVQALLASAEKKRAARELSELQKEIETKQAALDLENRKKQAAEVTLIQLEDALRELTQNTTRLIALSGEIEDKTELDRARTILLEQTKTTENSIRAQKDVVLSLDQSIRSQVGSLAQLRDKYKTLTDPDYAPKYTNNVKFTHLLKDCCESVQRAHQDVEKLDDHVVQNYIAGREQPDRQGLLLKLKTVAGILRRLQNDLRKQSALKSSDEIALRDCFRRVGHLVKEHCGGVLIDALGINFETNWEEYVKKHQGLLSGHLHRRDMAEKAQAQPVVLPEKEEKQTPIEDLLVTDMINKGVIKHLAGKNLAVYGGYAHDDLATWLQNAMNFASVSWYEYSKTKPQDARRAITSIASGKIDIVLVFTMAGHPDSESVVEAAKKKGLPLLRTSQIGRVPLCYLFSKGIAGVELTQNPKSIKPE